MPRFFTTHWQNRNWSYDRNSGQLRSSGSNRYRERGVSPGDRVYVISLIDGQFFLGGRMTVSRIMTRPEAVAELECDELFDTTDWVIDDTDTGTEFKPRRRLAPELTRSLRFLSRKSGPIPPFFVSDTHLDVQATRGVRELASESADLLDRVIAVTDGLGDGEVVVTLEAALGVEPGPAEATEAEYREGRAVRVYANRYERDPRARRDCLARRGTACMICEMDFARMYQAGLSELIHVHHLRLLSESGDRQTDPQRDLAPVCPNCHAVLHRRGGDPADLNAVRAMLGLPPLPGGD